MPGQSSTRRRPRSGRKHRSAVLERDSEDARLALRRQLEFIAQRVGKQVVRRSSRPTAGNTNQFCLVIVGRGDRGLFLRVPPFVSHDAVAVAVCPSEQGRMSGRSAGVGVIIVAVGEVSAVFEQQAKAAFAPLVAITLQVVAAKWSITIMTTSFGRAL